jgi:hypothetical protein
MLRQNIHLNTNKACLFYEHTVNLRYNELSDIADKIWQTVRFLNKIIWKPKKEAGGVNSFIVCVI